MPPQFQQVFWKGFPFLFAAAVVWNICAFTFLLWRRKVRGPHFPRRNEVNILFEERWTSGRSFKTFLTRIGGANNCLRVTLTDDELWVTPHFPFSALGGKFDLDHRIRRDSIVSMERNRKMIRLSYILTDGDDRTIELRLRKADEFYRALGIETPDGSYG